MPTCRRRVVRPWSCVGSRGEPGLDFLGEVGRGGAESCFGLVSGFVGAAQGGEGSCGEELGLGDVGRWSVAGGAGRLGASGLVVGAAVP